MSVVLTRKAIDAPRHWPAALGSICIVLGGFALLAYDRRVPFEYISTEIVPRIAIPGEYITIRRHVTWHRLCEGTAFTEIVSDADKLINHYDPGTRYPTKLGDTRVERIIALPPTMRRGFATYRGIIKFSTCGLTSRFWPIEVPYQEIRFEVR